MILYFSGTGNSEYVARRIGKEIGEEAVDLFGKIRSRDCSALYSEAPWVIVTPTYAWRIPRIVQDWLERTALDGSREIYFVMTCGSSIGNAGQYLWKLCTGKGMQYRGCAEIIMPENYIAMFTMPGREEALDIIQKADAVIDRVARCIRDGEPLPQRSISVIDRLSSGIVNDGFYPLCVHAKKFYTTAACISCGKCEAVCPLNNIRLVDGKLVWGRDCTHCMACICRCPKEAIEYGGHSKGQARYVCPAKVSHL